MTRSGEPFERGEALISTLTRERHLRVLDGTPTGLPRLTAAPLGFRAEDYLGIPDLEGYVTIREAAERMGLSEEEVERLAARFVLAYQIVGRTVYVRPAIIEG